MEVRGLLNFFGLLCFLFLFACSQKSVENTFQDNKNSPSGASCGGAAIENRFLVSWEDGRFTVEKAENKEVFIEKFLKPNLQAVRRAEFDRTLQVPDVIFANNSLRANATSEDWGQTLIEADALWNQNYFGQGVRVAVVDTGVDYSHPQIKPRLDRNLAEINGRPGVDDDGNGLIDDFYGWDFFANQPTPVVNSDVIHGSHVAGIILADHNTGRVAGLAPQATLIPANFMSPVKNEGGSIGAAILSIRYAVSRGAKIINASWGGGDCSSSLEEEIAGLAAKGILFVAASGNEYADLDRTPAYPASFQSPAQLTVAASRSSDLLADFSNTSYTFVHLGAPGADIFSSIPGGYASLSGTSMAAPFVSGAAALLWSARPTASLKQIRDAILNSVDIKNYRVKTRGRLNVNRAFAELKKQVP